MPSVSSLSKEYVYVPVVDVAPGSTVDLTTGTVQMAFTTIGTEPVANDWKSASWATDTSRNPDRIFAKCLVGPGGAVTLTDGTYAVWVKVSGIGNETPVKAAGTLTVT